jgi:phage tail sheath protein FI
MPTHLTYPGVYVGEIPGSDRPIAAVPTSIAAFVGRASRGPVNEATMIHSAGDYHRHFGGLSVNSKMSYAVYDFFRNGGSKAVIVRLYRADVDANTADTAIIAIGSSEISAASPGAWGNDLEIIVDHTISASDAADLGLSANQLCNVTVNDLGTGDQEIHRNVSIVQGSRQIADVLGKDSRLVRVQGLDASLDRLPAGSYKPSGRPASDGDALSADDYVGGASRANKEGLYAVEQVDAFNLLCIPPDFGGSSTYPGQLAALAVAFCAEGNAIFLYDPPGDWASAADAIRNVDSVERDANAALYFPRVRQPDPLQGNQLLETVPCGVIAGLISRFDATKGVWKSPAGIEATLKGIPELAVELTGQENGELNKRGVNCLRSIPAAGRVCWGARTLKGADLLSSEWKYLAVRRTALFITESLQRGLAWVVFEPNDEPLWSRIRERVEAFMLEELYRRGAFQGEKRTDAYFVKCDAETTTRADISRGVVNVVVGFAPLKPAEFVLIRLQLKAGQIP